MVRKPDKYSSNPIKGEMFALTRLDRIFLKFVEWDYRYCHPESDVPELKIHQSFSQITERVR